MRSFLFALLFVFLAAPAHALSLRWNTVTSDVDGAPLSPGNEVTFYKIYGCTGAKCTIQNAVFITQVPATVPAQPTATVDITGLPKPQSYFVTSGNLSGESGASNVVRVTPPHFADGLEVLP